MDNREARQIATGEYPDEGNGNYWPSAAVAPEGMNQLSSSTGDKRHTAKERIDLGSRSRYRTTSPATSPAVSQFASSLVMVWVLTRMPGSSSLATPELKLTVRLTGS